MDTRIYPPKKCNEKKNNNKKYWYGMIALEIQNKTKNDSNKNSKTDILFSFIITIWSYTYWYITTTKSTYCTDTSTNRLKKNQNHH